MLVGIASLEKHHNSTAGDRSGKADGSNSIRAAKGEKKTNPTCSRGSGKLPPGSLGARLQSRKQQAFSISEAKAPTGTVQQDGFRFVEI